MIDLFFPPPIPELKPTRVHNMDDGIPRFSVSRKRFTDEEQRQKRAKRARDRRARLRREGK